jgi:nicotinamidase-related amidase
MRIQKDNTIAMCIDIQSRLFPFMQDAYELQKRTINLINGLNALKIPVIVTEQYTKGLGETIQPVQKALGDKYTPLEKASFSVADDMPTLEKIKSYNKTNIILFGIESHVCLLQSAIDLKAKGYNVVYVADCVASRNENDKEIALRRLEHEGIIITTYESILFELLRYSGTEEFKAISKIVK